MVGQYHYHDIIFSILSGQALALFGLAMVGALDKDRVSRLLSVHLAVMLSVWYYTIHP